MHKIHRMESMFVISPSPSATCASSWPLLFVFKTGGNQAGWTRTSTRRTPDAALFQLSYDLWGDRRELHPHQENHNLPCCSLHHGHNAASRTRTRVFRLQAGCSPR